MHGNDVGHKDCILRQTSFINSISAQLVRKRFLPNIILSNQKELLLLLVGQPWWQYPTYLVVHQISIPQGGLVGYGYDLIIQEGIIDGNLFI